MKQRESSAPPGTKRPGFAPQGPKQWWLEHPQYQAAAPGPSLEAGCACDPQDPLYAEHDTVP